MITNHQLVTICCIYYCLIQCIHSWPFRDVPTTGTFNTDIVSRHQTSSLGYRRIQDDADEPRLFDFSALMTAPFQHRSSPACDSYLVRNVEDLHSKVLDQGHEFKQLSVQLESQQLGAQIFNHQVLRLIQQRHQQQSTPGQRNDRDILALSIEGGGMRGAVSAGMAAAIACLGLTDVFDVVYGSSAGSVVGAYFVSRQMCMDVYVDILPAAQKTFVCVQRMLSRLAVTGVDVVMAKWLREKGKATTALATHAPPGMNISFVLDGIMDHQHGIRPLDLECFFTNIERQPLRIASSYVHLHNGTMGTQCFDARDFRNVQSNGRRGIYSCLEASMSVPGATGSPVLVQQHKATQDTSRAYFDAFCFEPLPYRSAVQDGATHVLVLCSRPEGFQPKTQPGIYERAVAPLYFVSHNATNVARFFARGGQQYIYAEDLLTLEQGKRAGVVPYSPGVAIPPPRILYGVEDVPPSAKKREHWKRAHVLPLQVPRGTPELPTLEQGRPQVVEAVRGGFAVAFDLLAPVIGVKSTLTGMEMARFVFPDDDEDFEHERVLGKQLRVQGMEIPAPTRRKISSLLNPRPTVDLESRLDGDDELYQNILSLLPALKSGGFPHLAQTLQKSISAHENAQGRTIPSGQAQRVTN